MAYLFSHSGIPDIIIWIIVHSVVSGCPICVYTHCKLPSHWSWSNRSWNKINRWLDISCCLSNISQRSSCGFQFHFHFWLWTKTTIYLTINKTNHYSFQCSFTECQRVLSVYKECLRKDSSIEIYLHGCQFPLQETCSFKDKFKVTFWEKGYRSKGKV